MALSFGGILGLLPALSAVKGNIAETIREVKDTMKSFNILIIALVLSTLITAAAAAQEKQKLSGIKKIEETALLNNLDYKSAVLETLKAYNDLETSVKLDESSISLSGTYSKKTYSDETGYITAVTLPVFEKLSLGASVDEDFTRTFGVNIKPLEKSGSVEQTNLTYRTKTCICRRNCR